MCNTDQPKGNCTVFKTGFNQILQQFKDIHRWNNMFQIYTYPVSIWNSMSINIPNINEIRITVWVSKIAEAVIVTYIKALQSLAFHLKLTEITQKHLQ
jgi:hypothetical protein